jgi:PHD/YefM family antitoxin component YafN of YafNO toxin-antitoxin module
LHFKASVVHGEAIVIDVGENTRRLTIYRQGDPTAVIISGAYWIDPTRER